MAEQDRWERTWREIRRAGRPLYVAASADPVGLGPLAEAVAGAAGSAAAAEGLAGWSLEDVEAALAVALLGPPAGAPPPATWAAVHAAVDRHRAHAGPLEVVLALGCGWRP